MAVDESQKIPLLEKVGYSLGDSAANFVFLTMVCFQQGFYTDVMGLKPSQAALAILVPRLWDAFFDPIIGSTADRTKTRWGRFRPWILWTSVPWSIVMVLAYFTPTGLSNMGMLTWAIITNTLLMTLYSANNMPYAALGGVMTSDQSERNKLNAIRFGAVVFAQWIVQTFTLVIRDKFAGKRTPEMTDDIWKGHVSTGWTSTMAIYAVICLVCFLITFATTKERVQPVSSARRPLKQDLAGLLKNSPWIIMFIVTFVHFTLISYQGGAGYQYFTRYPDPQATYDVFDKLGMTDPTIGIKETPHGFLGTIGYLVPGTREAATHDNNAMYSALYGIQGTVSKIFQIIGIMMAPMLAARFGKKAVCIAAFVLSVIVNFAFYFLGPKDVGLMLVMTGVFGLVYGPGIPLLWAIFADVVDFGEWKLGIRTTGIVFATIGFALKAGLAFGGAALSWVEDAVGYTDTTPHVEMFRVSNTLVPAALFLVCAVALSGLILTKRKTQEIADELDLRRKQAAAAPAA